MHSHAVLLRTRRCGCCALPAHLLACGRPSAPALSAAAGADWEGVVLIPFIDEERLLAAARSVPPSSLTEEERQRNTLGDIMVFSHAPGEGQRLCTASAPQSQGCDSSMPRSSGVQRLPRHRHSTVGMRMLTRRIFAHGQQSARPRAR